MAVDRVVTSYLDELAGMLTTYRQRDRVLAEVSEHLQEHIEQLVAAGHEVSEATSTAVRALGDPKAYAGSFAAITAMPTTFTRWSGLAGLCGPLLFLALGLTVPQHGDRVPWHLVPPFLMMVIGLVGVIARTRGSFGRLRGWTASVLIVGGIASAAGARSYAVGVLCSVAVLTGLTLLLQTTFRVGTLPRPATLTIAVAGVTLVALIGSKIKEQSAPVYVAAAALFIGWCWLQYTLWSESKRNRRVTA